MSLPAAWVDKIFAKLTLAYGRDFLARWEGIDLNSVKSDWAHELAGFAAHPEAIAYGLAHLPQRAPSVFEFRALARSAPAPAMQRLEAPKADPARVAAELAKLAPLRARAFAAPLPGAKDWARRIIARHEAGGRINPTCLRFAREALGLEGRMAWQEGRA